MSNTKNQPGVYSDRIIIRTNSTFAYAALEAIKKAAPSNIAEAIDFVRDFSKEWTSPDGALCQLFSANNTHGFVYIYEGRILENFTLNYPVTKTMMSPA